MAFPTELQEIGKTCFGCTDKSGKQDGNKEVTPVIQDELHHFHFIYTKKVVHESHSKILIFLFKCKKEYSITKIICYDDKCSWPDIEAFHTSQCLKDLRDGECHRSLKVLLIKDPQKEQFHLFIQQLAATTEAPIRPQKGKDGFAHEQDSEGLAGGADRTDSMSDLRRI